MYEIVYRNVGTLAYWHNYFKAQNVSGMKMKMSWFRGQDLKFAKLKCLQKYLLSSTMKLECRKITELTRN